MGTLATFFKRTDFISVAEEPAAKGRARQRAVQQRAVTHAFTHSEAAPNRDANQLRALPNDDVYFFCKRIDNSRLVRQADPAAKGQCWSAIGATCAVAVIFGGMMVPKAATVLAGYKLQQLKQERAGLIAERKSLEVEEARILSPANMGVLASRQKLSSPSAGQIVHLQPKGESAVASVVVPASDLAVR
jgi:hypothetical protein